jgi:hypothetical protein
MRDTHVPLASPCRKNTSETAARSGRIRRE